MSALRRLRARLGQERGFTLIELLVSVIIGVIVTLATFDLLDASTRASTEVADRVDAAQRGRVAMEQITQRLRSQICLDSNTPAITYADDNEVRFYADLGDEVFQPEARSLSYSAGVITDALWSTLASPPINTFGQTPTTTRILLEDMAEAVNGPTTVPIFRYYAFLGNDPATPALLLQTPLTAADRARVVKISISFDSRPSRTAVAAPQTAGRVDSRFENDVFVRTADPSDPGHSPQCV